MITAGLQKYKQSIFCFRWDIIKLKGRFVKGMKKKDKLFKSKTITNRRKKPPEREKGAAPPDYMPAIFGWTTPEEMEEQAREIVDFTSQLEEKNRL